jgi:hypothetical protein
MAAPAVDTIVAKIQSAKAAALGPSSSAASTTTPAPGPSPQRLPFDIKPSALAGSGPQATIHIPIMVTTNFAQFRPDLSPTSRPSVEIYGIPDGAWFVDCSVDTGIPGTTPLGYEVVIQTAVFLTSSATMPTTSDTIASMPAQGKGHVALGLIYPPQGARHDNTLILLQASPWTWYGCSFRPV